MSTLPCKTVYRSPINCTWQAGGVWCICLTACALSTPAGVEWVALWAGSKPSWVQPLPAAQEAAEEAGQRGDDSSRSSARISSAGGPPDGQTSSEVLEAALSARASAQEVRDAMIWVGFPCVLKKHLSHTTQGVVTCSRQYQGAALLIKTNQYSSPAFVLQAGRH